MNDSYLRKTIQAVNTTSFFGTRQHCATLIHIEFHQEHNDAAIFASTSHLNLATTQAIPQIFPKLPVSSSLSEDPPSLQQAKSGGLFPVANESHDQLRGGNEMKSQPLFHLLVHPPCSTASLVNLRTYTAVSERERGRNPLSSHKKRN
jgi:hypothetical protein